MRWTAVDGTPIDVERTGSGPNVLLVHGSGTDRSAWAAVAADLAADHTVHAMDRRGRGASRRPGGAPVNSVEAESHDIAGVLDAIGEDCLVVAHSYGARCAIAALIEGARPRAAVLYEPMDATTPHYPRSLLDELAGLERDGEAEQALTLFFGTLAQVPTQAFDTLRETGVWGQARAMLGTLAAEAASWYDTPIDIPRLAEVDVPSTFLLGARSPAMYRRHTHRLAAVTGGEVIELPGEGHVAHQRSPAMFAHHVRTLCSVASRG